MRIIVTALLIGSALCGPALAQPDPRSACRSDYFKHCSAFRPGTPEVQKCFRDKIDQVSETCRTAIKATYGADGKKS